jgi:putative ABC transport system ATP-binding protein
VNPCLIVRDLLLEREKNGARFILKAPGLLLFPGRALCVVGQSGCGKSTLLDVLALILRPTRAGEFTLMTRTGPADLLTASPAALADIRGREIGYVLQSGGLLSFLSVRDNILLPGRLLGIRESVLQDRAAKLAKRIGIADQLDKKPQHLSGGQRQRAAIARALIHRPRLVFADEPTAAVDHDTATEIFAVFREMAEAAAAALVIVTHDEPLARRFADVLVGFSLERRGETVMSTLSHATPRKDA